MPPRDFAFGAKSLRAGAEKVIERTKILFPGFSVNDNEDVFILVSFISIVILFLVVAFSQIQIRLVERSRPANFKHFTVVANR